MTENRIKRKKTGIIWLIFTLVWMVVIFSFSAREADESAAMSHSVGKDDRKACDSEVQILVRR